MQNLWNCMIRNDVRGPYTSAELLKLFDHGTLAMSDLIRNSSTGKWCKIGEVLGQLQEDALGSQTTEAALPEHALSEPQAPSPPNHKSIQRRQDLSVRNVTFTAGIFIAIAVVVLIAVISLKIASIRGKAHGGAWVVKNAGNSDTLRGLRIFALKSPGRNEQLVAMLNTVLAETKVRLELEKMKWAEIFSDDDQVASVDLLEEVIQSLKDEIALASRRDGAEPVDMRDIYEVFKKHDIYDGTVAKNTNSEAPKIWAEFCSQHLAGTVSTDVDGKYELELPGGDYYLYASFDSAYYRIEWFVPARIADADGVKIDFHNENAALIKNK